MKIPNAIAVSSALLMLTLSACSDLVVTLPVIPTVTLQTRAGTYAYQEQPGEIKTKTGTVFMIIPRVSNKVPNFEVGISITGPSGWNADKELKFTVPAGSDWTLLPVIDATRVVSTIRVKISDSHLHRPPRPPHPTSDQTKTSNPAPVAPAKDPNGTSPAD
jgi:hypothetical protein